jgi:hypothetical protein
LAAIRKGLCSPKEAANCLDDYGDDGLEWACANCPKKRFEDMHEYTIKLFNLVALQDGGYPLEKDDLTLEEWVDLGRMRDVLEPRIACPLIGYK